MRLCEIVKRHKAGYFTHIRDESDGVLESVEEALAVAREHRIHIEIVHMKCSGVNNWGKAATVLDMIARAREEGCDVDCDAYPYAAGANPLLKLATGASTPTVLPLTGLQGPPGGIAVGTAGDLYLTDNRVLKVAAGACDVRISRVHGSLPR